MNAEVEETGEEVLAGLPGSRCGDGDLDHVVWERFDGRGGTATEEGAAMADEPGGHVNSDSGPDVVPR